jgi:hypothetical protein
MISERHSLQWSTVMLKRKSHNRLPVRKSQVQTANLVLGPAAGRGRISLTLTGKDIDVCVLSGGGNNQYLAMRLSDGSYHFFTEVESKAAAKECLRLPANVQDDHTRDFCKKALDVED